MSDTTASGSDWSDSEIDLIVADYFDMLSAELAGEPYVKAHRNTALQGLIKRTRGSIERKHQNISAVLAKLGLPWILGYKPLANFQNALIDGIERFIVLKAPDLTVYGMRSQAPAPTGLAEPTTIFIELPPPITQRDDSETAALVRLLRKFDPAERDSRNRMLGRSGEEVVLSHERARPKSVGREDLSRKVRWVSEEDGDGAGYDISSFTPDGRERLLEVKTTVGGVATPFFLSENERRFSTERPEAFRIMRLYDFRRELRAFEIAPPLASSLILSPSTYRASFS